MASTDLNTSFHGIAARLDRLPISGFQKKIMWLLAGITFCDSVDMAVGGPIGMVLQDQGFMTLEQFAFFNSITMIGYLIGGLLAGAISDGIGRRKAVLICGSLFTVFCFVAAASPDANFLTGCRFFMGVGLGAAFPAGYSALTEFTPPQKRGKYQSYVGLIANCGTLFASVMNLIILPIAGWREVFVFCGILGAVVMILCFVFLEESPRWLALMGKNEKADAIVTRLEKNASAKGELAPVPAEEIERCAAAENVEQLPWKFLFTKKMITRTLTAMFLCFVMNVLVYTVISWTPTILKANGFDTSLSTLMTVVMQLGIPVGVGALTFYVEKVNRKTILIVTYVLIAILGPIWAMLPTDQPALVMGFGFLVCVCTFTNSVTTAAIYLSEPFPTACRIRGAGIANAFGRLGGILSPMWIAFFVASSFGTLGAYIINSALAIFMAIWLAIFAVETRGRTLEDITKGLLD
ncbi:MFS transporter [Eggerthella sp. YY7918]|uniref:MFS transporter n=1 Tax=Eggerthella sp. (strain YY7918) TaxID=502558 RepID=UPI0002D8079C|nr:MFS transporter [Eggerthella sp. YY7918]